MLIPGITKIASTGEAIRSSRGQYVSPDNAEGPDLDSLISSAFIRSIMYKTEHKEVACLESFAS